MFILIILTGIVTIVFNPNPAPPGYRDTLTPEMSGQPEAIEHTKLLIPELDQVQIPEGVMLIEELQEPIMTDR